MALSIIGSGFGRTGTKSLKEAVEQLGFAPCHHMHEIVEHPEQVAHWQALAAGKPVDWNEVFAGYRSQVDWPGAYAWRQLSEAYPEAKVVHSTRPADAWWNSYSKTIAKLMTNYENIPLPLGDTPDGGVVVTKVITGELNNYQETRLVTLLQEQTRVMVTGDEAVDPLRTLVIRVVNDNVEARPRVCRVPTGVCR